MDNKNKKSNLGVLIKIIVSAVLFYIIFNSINFEQVTQNIKSINIYYILLVILLIILNYIVSSVRWKYLIIHANAENIKLKFLVNLYFIGSFFNNFMPTSMGGDVFKVYSLGKKINSKTNAFAATFMERFTGMMALIFISYFGLVKTMSFWTSLLPDFIQGNNLYTNLFKFSLFFGFWIAALLMFFVIKLLSKKISFISKIYSSFLEYKYKKNVLYNALLTSFVVQVLAILSQYLVFTALNVQVDFYYAIAVLPVITLAGFFIPSLNGLGIQDALYIQFFTLVGVSAEIALTASIMYHLCRLVISLFGGVLYAMGKDK